ncbi:MAG: 5'-methylthioadenosine/adenosylhomocysteine nucleosidase [Dorea sp.]|mgnify:FL=1|nr:5'-methylthioadenosine/adenosylhomocysteine nucleosidase [Dorea sp.]
MIGIIGAMEEEVAALKEAMDIHETVEQASMVFCKGVLCGKEVVIVRSGIGKVNAGICAQILVDRFKADTLINTGIAGSLDAKIDIGDMVISTDALHHDMDATEFGYPVGQVPRMEVMSFPADEELVKKAVQASEKANPDIHTFTGRVASGDQFIASREVKDKIVENFHPLCVEMEGAGIAHAAHLNKVSYVIIRAISDKADNSASVDYPTFERQAIAHSVRLVKELLTLI